MRIKKVKVYFKYNLESRKLNYTFKTEGRLEYEEGLCIYSVHSFADILCYTYWLLYHFCCYSISFADMFHKIYQSILAFSNFLPLFFLNKCPFIIHLPHSSICFFIFVDYIHQRSQCPLTSCDVWLRWAGPTFRCSG